ncbi:hypothetical protein HAX54_008418 [Datura stramonium]|uniref:Uncharacterized protein n=1 Tax=Datura stramonium TaxID=4076 RepID=A0ABS8RVD7_DATST|nr:hypothetical protein [Datura stramonium]
MLEAQTVEDIELAFRGTSEKETENSNVHELPNAKPVAEESGSSGNAAVQRSSSQNDSGMPEVEARTIEDIESAFRINSEKEIVHLDVLEQPNAKLGTEESGDSDDAEVFDVSSSVQEDSGMPQPNVELATEESEDSADAAVFDVSSSVQQDSGMPVVEAQTAEDINLAFRQIAEQETAEKSNVLEQPNSELATEESGDSDDAAVFEVSSLVQEDSGMPVLEAQTAEDINLAFRQIYEQEIAEKSDVLEQPNAELGTEESGVSADAAVFDVEQISEQETAEKSNVLEQPNAELATEESGNIAAAAEASSSALEDSEMPVLEAQTVEDIDMVFRRISEKEMEKSNVLEQPNVELATEVSGSSDDTAVLEASSMTRNMQLPILETRPTEYFDLDYENFLRRIWRVSEFGEVETGQGDHEAVVKEAEALTAEKPDHAVDIPTTADVKGKKDKSHKKGSSSSSSSDSSSSDSDKE